MTEWDSTAIWENLFIHQSIKIVGRWRLLTEWKCSDCGYSMSGDAPPEVCPSCNHKCEFIDVTCYTPDCEKEGRDYRLWLWALTHCARIGFRRVSIFWSVGLYFTMARSQKLMKTSGPLKQWKHVETLQQYDFRGWVNADLVNKTRLVETAVEAKDHWSLSFPGLTWCFKTNSCLIQLYIIIY